MIAKILKRLLWAVVIFIVLGTALVFALPRIVPTEKVAHFLQDKVREQTGRDLAFSGVKFSFWPNVGIELSDVTLGNPPWAQQKNMVSLGKADVALRLMPLLGHHIVVKKFMLDAPVIYLETGADGRRNWDFSGTAAAPAAANANAEAVPERHTGVSAASDFDFRFGRIQIGKGRLVIANQQKKTAVSLDDVDIDVTLPDLRSQLKVKGALTYKSKRLTLDAMLDRPLDFFNGRTSSGQIGLKADNFSINADGAFAMQGTLLKGDVDVKTPQLAEVFAWLKGAPVQKLAFENLAFSGAARVMDGEIILKEANLALDEVKANGDLDVEFSGKPAVFARLSMNKLDLDRFIGGNGGGAAPASSGASAPATPAADASGWNTRRLDFSGLNLLNADLKLRTQGFSLKGVEAGPSQLAVQVTDGNLHFTSSEASLAGGKFSADMRLRAATPGLSLAFNMAGVQAQPILAAFMHFKKLSGAATAHVTLTATGDSQKALIGNLAGHGDVDFKNGELQGIDLVKIAQLVQAHAKDVGMDEGATKFVDISGTFSVMKGIVSNADLRMKGNVVQASGQGVVDLPKKFIQYTVTPVLIASSNAPPALSVPVKIAGPFSDIKAIPDFATTVRNVIKNPAGAKAAIKNIGDNLKNNAVLQKLLHSGLLGKFAPAAPSAAPPAAPAQPTTPKQ